MQNNGHAFTELLESAKIYFDVMSSLNSTKKSVNHENQISVIL